MYTALQRIVLAVLLFVPGAAWAQTACTVQNQTAILSSMADNVPAGSITPQVLRNFACSTLQVAIPMGQIYVGNGSGLATAVTPSGDLTMSSGGAFTLGASGVTAGSYAGANITVDAKGRVTSAANGTGAPPGGTSGQIQINVGGTSFGGVSTTGTGNVVLGTGPTITGGTISGATITGATGISAGSTGSVQTNNGAGGFAGVAPSALGVTATGASASQTLATRFAETLNVLDYGAKCDNSTDDATAINTVTSLIRTMVTSNMQSALVMEFPPSINNGSGALNFRRCVVRSTLNFTGIYSSIGNTLNVTVEGHGTEIYGSVPGAPVIDALGSNQMIWRNIHVISDNVNVPTSGIQIGRTAPTVSDYGGGAGMRFDDVVIVGYFSTAAFYNFASEEVIFTRPRFINSYNSANAYAYIADGFNHFNITSAFVTQTAPVDSPQSFEENTFIGGSFQANGATMVSPIWLGAATQHRFINVYAYGGSSAPSCVTLYNAAAGGYLGLKGIDLDIHCEGSAVTNKILINGTLASPVIRDLTVRDVYEFSTGNIFKLGGSATSATLEHPQIYISGGPVPATFTLFDTANNYNIVGGDIYLYSSAPFGTGGVTNVGISNFSGRLIAPGATLGVNGTNCVSNGPITNSTSTRNWLSVAKCETTISVETSGSTAVRLTTDGTGTASASNCVNLPIPYGSSSSATLTIVGRDRATTANTVIWSDWPMTYGSPSNASTSQVVTGTKPTPITTGTVTGTDISATADTTNGCINVTWTPPTGNTDLWDVAGFFTFRQVR